MLVVGTIFSVSAFGGYAHYTMGALKAALSGRSEQIQLAYISGCLLADIGKTTWDSDLREWYENNGTYTYPENYYTYNEQEEEYNEKYFASDEFLFMDAMYNVSNYLDDLSTSAKIMAYGWRDHYIQDKYGSVFSIPSHPSTSYSINCGWIDEYLRDELILCDYPIQNDEIAEIYVSYKLINRTYRAITNGAMNPTVEEIQAEILDMFAAYDAQILANLSGWNATQKTEIMNELDRVVAYCPGIVDSDPANYEYDLGLPITTSIFLNSSLNSAIPQPAETMSTITTEDIKINDFLTQSDLDELTKYMEIEETPISDSEAYLKISVTDSEAYANALEILCVEKAELMKGTFNEQN